MLEVTGSKVRTQLNITVYSGNMQKILLVKRLFHLTAAFSFFIFTFVATSLLLQHQMVQDHHPLRLGRRLWKILRRDRGFQIWIPYYLSMKTYWTCNFHVERGVNFILKDRVKIMNTTSQCQWKSWSLWHSIFFIWTQDQDKTFQNIGQITWRGKYEKAQGPW